MLRLRGILKRAHCPKLFLNRFHSLCYSDAIRGCISQHIVQAVWSSAAPAASVERGLILSTTF